ncbi:MAG TPA: hypothetical protein VFQ45_07625 [Longimicrobium sp.]|nr:hypothetical protein [Longimicrobium sp.]
MPTPSGRASTPAALLDTNVIIEAVRIRGWKALAGGRRVETVEECRNETQRGAPHRPGYVTVTAEDLSGLAAVHAVTDVERAVLVLAYPDAPDLDAGERDLLAHALAREARGDSVWIVCSPDKACIRAVVALGFGDHMVALEELLASVGAHPKSRIAQQYTKEWLSRFRTACLLGH